MPPASHSVSREGYLPSQMYNFNSSYGSPDDLRRCVAAYSEAGVQCLADCVFNHRCGDRQNAKGEWLRYSCARLRSLRSDLRRRLVIMLCSVLCTQGTCPLTAGHCGKV
jgi:Alpha amylase, catalytic domain